MKLPVKTLPISPSSTNFLATCPPPPKKVSGALPIYKLLSLAKFTNSFASSYFIDIGFSL